MMARVRASANARACAAATMLTLVMACAASPRTPDTIVIASGTDLEGMQPLTTVHPMSRQVQRYLVFTPLVRLSDAMTPEPWAASGWTWSADRREVRFVIDTSLRWHDGAMFTAADAQFTLHLAARRDVGYPRRAELSGITRVDAPSPDTLRLTFDRAQSDVPFVMAELPIVPAHILRDVAPARLRQQAFTYAPIGSGPYRVVRREAGRRWILERMPRFPARLGGSAATRNLVIAVVDEATTKVAGLVSGSVDVAGVNPATATLVRRDPTLRVLDYPTFFTNWLFFNPGCPAVRDVRVRRAVATSLDRQRIVAAGIGGFGTPNDAVAADIATGAPTPPDPSGADALLDAAGWRRGGDGMRRRNDSTLTLVMLSVGAGDNPVEQLMQADLRARGIDLRIATRELGALLTAARARDAGHCLVYSGVPGDPSHSQLAALFDPTTAGSALDLGEMRPRSIAAAFAALRAAPDSATRTRAWKEVLTILRDSLPATAVFHSRGVQGLSKRLEHVTMDLRGELVTAARWVRRPERTAP